MAASRGETKIFLFLAFILATCSLVYELAFAKVISELTGNPTMWESLSMGSFLLGIGAQTVFGKIGKNEDLWERLIRNEILIAALAVVSWYLVHYFQMNYRAYIYDNGQLRELLGIPPVYLLGLSSQPLIFAIGWLSGFELTFFLSSPQGEGFRHREAVILAVYHFGALAGTLIVIAALRLAVAPINLITVFASINMGLSLYVIIRQRTWRRLVSAVSVCLFIGWSVKFSGYFEQVFLKNHYYNQLNWTSDGDGLKNVSFPDNPFRFAIESKGMPAIKRLRSPFQVIDFVFEKEDAAYSSFADEESMYINGRFQISRRSSSEYHEYMAHVSLGFANRLPENIAVLGGGDGALIAELLKHPVRHVELVEIDPVIITLASSYPTLTELNDKSLLSPRVNVVQQDAFRFMRKTDHIYDAIFIDLTYPFDFDSAKFYSSEFLSLVNKRLSTDGILIAGIPMDLVNDNFPDISNLVKSTIRSAGFVHAVTFNHSSHHFILVSKAPLPVKPTISNDVVLKSNLTRGIAKHDVKVMDLLESEPVSSYSIQFPDTLMVNDPFY